MKRREFIGGLGSAAAWPLAARAQRATAPLIGYLGAGTAESTREVLAAFHRGLSETGYVEGRNLVVEYRWAEHHYERLPALAADLVSEQVSVIVALQNTASSLAARAATSTIPIVFSMGNDPVQIGLVTSINRPGGNVTGISNFIDVVAAKRLELLHELVPAATSIAYLVNPTNSAFAEIEKK
jgi:putative tryptophan/tyrosine transport system substrate-binding protein